MKADTEKIGKIMKPYKAVYLIMTAVSMLINGLLASYLLILSETDPYMVLKTNYKVVLWVLFFASVVMLPLSVIFSYLDKYPVSFFTVLAASLIISYVGFYLTMHEASIPFSTVILYQGTSLLLPVICGVLWIIYKKVYKKMMPVVFSKTEKDIEKQTPSILD